MAAVLGGILAAISGFASGGVVGATAPPNTPPDTSEVVARRSGDVTIVDGDSRAMELQRGGSATEFALEAPPAAACPGDSENDSWRVQTFVIPAADDPGTLAYTVIGPVAQYQWAVYGTDYTPVTDAFTVANDVAGMPARIADFRPMSFGVFVPGSAPDGTYRIGIACTWFGATADYWDTEIVITNDATDQPAQLTWRLADAPVNAPSDDSSAVWTWVIVGAAVAATLVVLVAWRRKATAPTALGRRPVAPAHRTR